MSLTLRSSLSELKECFVKGNSSLDEKQQSKAVTATLQQLDFDPSKGHWRKLLNTQSKTYCRHLLAYNHQFSVVLLCWKPGQATPLHRHDAKSKAWIRVLQGRLSLTRYRAKGGKEPQADSSETLNHGSVYEYSEPFLGLHTMGNPFSPVEQDNSVAYSLHVFSPPIIQCCDNPAVYCTEARYYSDESERLVARTSSLNGGDNIYTNFRTLVEVLHQEIDPIEPGSFHTPEHIAKIQRILGAMRFNRDEFAHYAQFSNGKYTRNLVGYDVPVGSTRAKFTVLILCWDKGQMSPIHDHAGSSCWVKVLQGNVREVRYDVVGKDADGKQRLEMKADNTFGAEQVAYINDTMGIHAMGNPNSNQVAISMHIYSPPYILCKLFDETTGDTKTASMSSVNMPRNPFQVLEDGVHACVGSSATKRVRLSGSTELAPLGAQQASLTLEQFLGCLKKAIDKDPTCPSALDLLGRLAFEEREWREFVHFDPYRYTRSLVALDSRFSLMVLCWNKGQDTPIHEHGEGVHSWAKVLNGSLRLKQYSNTVSEPLIEGETVFAQGDCIDEAKFAGLHGLGNASSETPAVSLHLFTPPYVAMGYFDEKGVERSIPVVHSATSLGRCCSDTSTQLENPALQTIYTDLESCAECMDRMLDSDDIQGTSDLLKRFQFHKEEWQRYIGTVVPLKGSSQALVARKDKFALVIKCFQAGFKDQPTRGKASWMKILQGELVERIYSYADRDGGDFSVDMCLEEIHRTTLPNETVAYLSNKVTFSMENRSSQPCFVLQLVML